MKRQTIAMSVTTTRPDTGDGRLTVDFVREQGGNTTGTGLYPHVYLQTTPL